MDWTEHRANRNVRQESRIIVFPWTQKFVFGSVLEIILSQNEFVETKVL